MINDGTSSWKLSQMAERKRISSENYVIFKPLFSELGIYIFPCQRGVLVRGWPLPPEPQKGIGDRHPKSSPPSTAASQQTVIIPTKTQLFVSLAILENKIFLMLHAWNFSLFVVSPGDNWIRIQLFCETVF